MVMESPIKTYCRDSFEVVITHNHMALDPITTGISLAGQIFGAYKSAQANKEAQRLIDQQKEENASMYNNNANKDFLQTNVAKDATKEMQQNLEDSRKAVAGRGAVTGASDEAINSANTNANKTYVDGLSRLASKGTDYQNQQEAIYRQQNSILNQQQMGMYKQKGQSATNLGANAGELATSIAGLSGMATKKDSPTQQDTSIFKD
jgi:hypothetical protein